MANNQTKQAHWTHHLKNWEKSGLSQKEYCKQEGLKKSTFQYWRIRLKKSQKNKAGFVELKVKDENPKNYLEIVTRNNYVIRIQDNFNTQLLIQLLNILENL